MLTAVTLLVRSSAKGGRWRRHEVYASRDEAWVAITALQDRTAHVRLVEQEAVMPIGTTEAVGQQADIGTPTSGTPEPVVSAPDHTPVMSTADRQP